ncbi:hypothetical protein ACFE04_025489 [Oxalis oulophora]
MSSTKKIVLERCVNKNFKVDEDVALESQLIKHMIEDDCAENEIPLPNVTSNILSKMIEYRKKNVPMEGMNLLSDILNVPISSILRSIHKALLSVTSHPRVENGYAKLNTRAEFIVKREIFSKGGNSDTYFRTKLTKVTTIPIQPPAKLKMEHYHTITKNYEPPSKASS